VNSDWHFQTQRIKRRRENMGRFEKFIEEIHNAVAEENQQDEQVVLPLKKKIPAMSGLLKKLANGVYGQQIKDLNGQDKVELMKALDVVMRVLEKSEKSRKK
jgi:hypothetical protein